ncbi:hypothetical protein ABE458_27420 [Pseudomonas protegens]|uniref:hypothetical protein n=1 Tax=Pseudomonas protegens TaxID=380021 RepID=UPI0032089A20
MTTIKAPVTIPAYFSQEELDSRKEKAKYNYINGYVRRSEFGSTFVLDSCFVFHDTTLESFVDGLAQLALNGQARHTYSNIVSGVGYYSAHVYKTPSEQDDDLQVIMKDVEESYRSELAEEKQKQIETLTEQLLAAELNKEQKKEEDRLSKLRIKAQQEAQEFFKSVAESK